MSIQIPCPKCGRELKLPDRSLLGRKGKCPKCSHTFVLEEPPVVTLELAQPDGGEKPSKVMPPVGPVADTATVVPMTTVSDTSPSASFGSGSEKGTSDSSQTGPQSGVSSALPPELAVLEQLVKPSGAAARLKELQKKNARRRNMGLLIAGVILACVGTITWFAPRFAAKNSGGKPTEQVTDDLKATVADDSDKSPASQTASPTKGKPIELQYIPFGTQVVIHLRPAELWTKDSLGEELRFCIPPIAELVEKTLQDLFRRKPEEVEELLICLLPGTRGSLPDVAAVVHMVEDQKRSQLIEQFGQRIDTYAYPIYESDGRAYLIVDQKTLAVCPRSQAPEMIEAINDRHPVEQIDPLLPLTDRDRQITVVFTPLTLSLQESWFPVNVRPFVSNALEWLGEETETVSWSLHLTEEQFYSDLLLRPKNAMVKSSAKKLEQDVMGKLAGLAEELVPWFQQMNPREQGKRTVIGRVPAMVEVFSLATMSQVAPQHVRLITSLPDRGAPNLALGTLLAWDESTRTDFSKAKPKPATAEPSAVPEKLADRMKMKIDVDFRKTPMREAFGFIGGEIKASFEIDGDALKLGGFTKNIEMNFKNDAAKVQDIIVRIIKEAKGVDQPPEKTLVVIIDEAKKGYLVTTQSVAESKGLVAIDLTR